MKESATLKIVTFAVLGVLVLVAMVKVKYGTGKEYPDVGANLPTESFVLEKLIQLDYPPGNLAVAKNGDVYFNYHPVAKAERFSPATVFKWSSGKVEPFPSLEAQKDFQGTFGMTIDNQGRIWFIEPASFDFKHTRVSAFDLNTLGSGWSFLSFLKDKRSLLKTSESQPVVNTSLFQIQGSSASQLRVLSSIPS